MAEQFPSYLLQEVNENLRGFAYKLHKTQIGNLIRFKMDESIYNETEDKIFLLNIPFFSDQEIYNENISQVRKNFYALQNPNWDLLLYDLGDIVSSGSTKDSQYAIREVLSFLNQLPNARIILINNKHNSLKEALHSFQLEKEVKWVHFSKSLGLLENEFFDQTDFFFKEIFTDDNINLSDFKLLGYQSFFVAQEELDLLRNLNFHSMRLGEIISDISKVEPELRESNYVSVDFDVIQYPDYKQYKNTINGLNSREICAISRYSGFSDELNFFSLFPFSNEKLLSTTEKQLISQIIWYFLEGVNQNWSEHNFQKKEIFKVYSVLLGHTQIVFYKSIKTEKWWIKLSDESNNEESPIYSPCSENDYKDACNNKIPQKWSDFYKKSL